MFMEHYFVLLLLLNNIYYQIVKDYDFKEIVYAMFLVTVIQR